MLFLAAATLSGCPIGNNTLLNTGTCLECHDGQLAVNRTGFLDGAHYAARIDCQECHGPGLLHVRNGGRDGLFIIQPAKLSFEDSYALCGNCHEDTVDAFVNSQHAVTQAANCFDCHNIHTATTMVAPTEDNSLCLACHGQMEFTDNRVLDEHISPFHTVDLEGVGVGRCTTCHMPPIRQADQDTSPSSHTFATIPPLVTAMQLDAGVESVAPNSCAGTDGCHDANVPGSGTPRDLNDADLNRTIQSLFDFIGEF